MGNVCDNCPAVSNTDQADTNIDGVGDVCDNCPSDSGKTEPGICGCGISDIDSDGDGTSDCNDCDDNDNTIYPGALELCDGVDNDCDGSVDEGAYDFGGFQQPINPDGSSIFKRKRTIPVKIVLTDCNGQLVSTATVTIAVYKLSNSVQGTEFEQNFEPPGNANTGNLFRYDDSEGQYIFNLSTKNLSKGTYRLYATPVNGASHVVGFSLN